jgi:hypothetical protein
MGLAALLGFILPLSYAFTLSEVSDYTGKPAPNFIVMPFGWPRPIWIFLTGRQPTEADIFGGIIFTALCNIALYGAISYAALTMLAVLRRKPVEYESPPPPQQKYS